MIRDRLKSGVRRAALRMFGMEWDASERPADTGRSRVVPPGEFDASVIPRVVDGSGDTPGPKHLTDIGRTWLAAQVVGGVGMYVYDIRPPAECAAGIIKGARVVAGQQLRQRLDLLPPKDTRVTIYDQLGSDDAAALAAFLRDQGWTLARRLVGGYAEWIEHAEPITVPEAPAGGRYVIGQMVEPRGKGRRGYVQEAVSTEGGPRYVVWFEDGSFTEPLDEHALTT
jgi:rhodanese-related sulfurtransferase